MNIKHIAFLSSILAFGACDKSEVIANKPDVEEPSEDYQAEYDRLLKLPIKDIVDELYDENFFIGTANHEKLIGTLSDEIALREFDYFTPSNDFKQAYIHPIFDSWRWDKCNRWIDHATNNDAILRLHAPISPQCSKWAQEDTRTAEEMTQMLNEYMTALCKRYNGTDLVKWLDVVNETIATQNIDDPLYGNVKAGEWFGPRQGTEKWQNPWPIIGYDEASTLRVPLYIDMAFAISNEYAPNIKQIINQHGDFEEVVWKRMKELVSYLESKGRRIDGIGWQAHIDTGWEKQEGYVERLDEFIKWCHSKRMEFHITEMNVWIRDGDVNKESAQTDTYEAVLNTLLKNRHTGVVCLNFWNVRDEDCGNPDWMGCIWRNDGTARPAYEMIKKRLIEEGLDK